MDLANGFEIIPNSRCNRRSIERSSARPADTQAEVIANARRIANEISFSSELVGAMYELLVEGSIAYELDRFDRTDFSFPG